MPSLRSAWEPFDLGCRAAAYSNGDTVKVQVPVPFAGTIKEVWVGALTTVTTGGGIVALAKGSTNILSASNVDLQSGLTAGTAALQTLAANGQTLKVAAGDILSALWTLTTVGSFDGGACRVYIEPDNW